MSFSDVPDHLFVIAWDFQVKPENREEFEEAYGPCGDWVRLFRTCDGYIKTELHRSSENPARYITLDFWTSRDQYRSFKESAKAEYREIDARCERLMENERLIGEFRDVASLRAALPAIGRGTQILPAVSIRPATVDDVPAMIQLERSMPSAAHWTETAYAEMFKETAVPRIVLTAVIAVIEDGPACGFAVARIVADECELENIVVAVNETRQRIGSRLLEQLMRAAQRKGIRKLVLEVRESNSPARALYEKCGFRVHGRRPRYYSSPEEDAVLYSIQL